MKHIAFTPCKKGGAVIGLTPVGLEGQGLRGEIQPLTRDALPGRDTGGQEECCQGGE